MIKGILMTAAWVIAAATAQAESTTAKPQTEARYEVVASGNNVWVLDTFTGQVKKCGRVGAGPDAPLCTSFSKPEE